VIAQILPLADFTAPKIEYGELSPLLVVFGAACVGVLVEAFLPRPCGTWSNWRSPSCPSWCPAWWPRSC